MRLPWKPDLAILENFRETSGGGEAYVSLVNLRTGVYDPVDNEFFLDASPSGRQFLAMTREWRGGYKRPGSAPLSRMYLWNAKTLSSQQVGFRLMECSGALFVSPAKGALR